MRSLRGRLRPDENVVALVLIAVTLWYAARFAIFFARVPGPTHFDDGYVVALAERLIDGRFLPYVDGVSHRGPLLYWSAAPAQLAVGRFEWTGSRLFVSAAFLATLLGCVATGFAARRLLAGAIAGAFYLFMATSVLDIPSVFGLLGETVGSPLAVWSMASVTWAMCRPARRRPTLAALSIGGALAALAMLAKQTYLPIIGPYVVWALAATEQPNSGGWRARLVAPAALLAGWAVPVLGVLVIYGSAREFPAFWYWFFTYNADVYMDPYRATSAALAVETWIHDHPLHAIGLAVLIVGALGRVAWHIGQSRQRLQTLRYAGLPLTLALNCLLVVAACMAPLRFWTQYYIPPVPWVGLLLGIGAEEAIRGGRPAARWASRIVVVPAFSAFFGNAAHKSFVELIKAWRGGAFAGAFPEPACELIQRHSTSVQPIFIWGFDADLYITCKRHPASRFLYTTLVAGIVPPEWHDQRPNREARGAQDTLMRELSGARPPLILDFPDRLQGLSMTLLPRFNRYLHDNYCTLPRGHTKDKRTFTPWLRRDLCPAKSADTNLERR